MHEADWTLDREDARRPRLASPVPARLAVALAGFLAAVGAAGCSSTQRVVGPLWLEGDPADASLEAPVATVVRHAGPVEVHRPGAPAGYRLSYYSKRARVQPGAKVQVGSNGRAELQWPDEGPTVLLFGNALTIVGAPARDEPLLTLRKVLRAELHLTPTDRVILPGGCELRGDDVRPSGPFLVEHDLEKATVRVTNQSIGNAVVLFRDGVIALLPGDAIDLPVLAGGAAPIPSNPSVLRTTLDPFVLESVGRVEPSLAGEGVLTLRAVDAARVRLGGVVFGLEAGQAASFSTIGGTAASSSEPGRSRP